MSGLQGQYCTYTKRMEGVAYYDVRPKVSMLPVVPDALLRKVSLPETLR
jgi:hypothetical protein